jgi:hypothetical protein
MATKKFLLTWTPPVGNIVITGYKAEYSLAGNNNWTEYSETFTTTSGFVTGLDICTYYDFRVFAVNSIGTGLSSNTGTGIKGNIPFAPVDLSGSPTDSTIELSWTMPNNGGCPITKSFVEYKVSGAENYTVDELNDTNTSYSVTGLTEAIIYDLRVRSVNIVGTGTYSTGIFVKTLEPTVPGQATDLQVEYVEVLDAPTGVIVSVNGSTADISWDSLDMTNKIPLSGYYVRYKDSSTTDWDTSTLFDINSGTITGLTGTNCYTYDFGVAGLNISGTLGEYSISTTGYFGAPSAPTDISIAYDSESFYFLSFNSPSDPSATAYYIYIDNTKTAEEPTTLTGTSDSIQLDNAEGKVLKMSSVNDCGEGPLSTGVIVPLPPDGPPS